jgi:nucleoside-diphosphate-sugar epimerase
MRVLVTGANGFVGSHIVEELLAQGHTPVCLVRAASNLQWLRHLKLEYRLGDVTETQRLPAIVNGCDAIIHAAGVLRAILPRDYYCVNQSATRELCAAVTSHAPGLKKFVFISSQAAMGPAAGREAKACHEQPCPVSDYGKSKLAAEKELHVLQERVPYTILRPASVYGPRDRDIFIFFNLVHYGIGPTTFSKKYLQLLFVKDLAAAAVRALTNDATNGGIYPLAEETGYTWNDISRTIGRAIGKRTVPLYLPDFAFHLTAAVAEKLAAFRGQAAVLNRQKAREMLHPYWLCDVSNARRDLLPDFTKFEFGATITYNWYKENNWF